jgi:hypothetical protein
MFISNAGLVIVAKAPGESANLFYKKSEIILEKIESSIKKNQSNSLNQTYINKNNNHKFYSTPSQIDQLYNKSFKQASEAILGCKYY